MAARPPHVSRPGPLPDGQVRQLTAMAAFSYQVNIEARSLPLCLRALGSGAGTAL